MSREDVELIYRPLNPEDKNFLHDSWGSSYFKGTNAIRLLTPDEFHAYHRPIRERFFSKPNTTVIVCSPKDDPWLIVGWIAVEVLGERPILHYVYVKNAFKQHGIATELIKRSIHTDQIIFTHKTERFKTILTNNREKYKNFHHVPHLV